jgi:chromosome segregation ATPase
MATASTPAHWQPIGETVAEFRNECADFEHLIESLFDQLDVLRCELGRKMHDLQQERDRVAQRERELAEQREENQRAAHQFEHQEAKLSAALSEIDELKNVVASQQESSVESAALAQELAAAQHEISELRAQLLARPAGGANDQQVAELEQERSALESELELVRGRAAELYDSLSQERRVLNELRTESAAELKQLRRLVERQSELLAERATSGNASNTLTVSRETIMAESARESADDAGPAADPVVNSVMAQFAKLQKEVAERRKQRK